MTTKQINGRAEREQFVAESIDTQIEGKGAYIDNLIEYLNVLRNDEGVTAIIVAVEDESGTEMFNSVPRDEAAMILFNWLVARIATEYTDNVNEDKTNG